MATFTINTRDHGPITFFVRDTARGENRGYVYLGTGTDGRQICAGGDYVGNTLMATVDTLESVARKWHRQHLKLMRENGITTYF